MTGALIYDWFIGDVLAARMKEQERGKAREATPHGSGGGGSMKKLINSPENVVR